MTRRLSDTARFPNMFIHMTLLRTEPLTSYGTATAVTFHVCYPEYPTPIQQGWKVLPTVRGRLLSTPYVRYAGLRESTRPGFQKQGVDNTVPGPDHEQARVILLSSERSLYHDGLESTTGFSRSPWQSHG